MTFTLLVLSINFAAISLFQGRRSLEVMISRAPAPIVQVQLCLWHKSGKWGSMNKYKVSVCQCPTQNFCCFFCSIKFRCVVIWRIFIIFVCYLLAVEFYCKLYFRVFDFPVICKQRITYIPLLCTVLCEPSSTCVSHQDVFLNPQSFKSQRSDRHCLYACYPET